VVGADEHVDYGRVYEAMTLLQSAGAVKIGLMSQPKDSARKP
jgi:biopolymer transport protein TolR